MTVVQKSVDVEQATYAAGQALAKFVADVKAALKTGNSIAEVTGVASAALNDLLPVVASVPTLKLEATENLWAEADTLYLTGRDVVKALVS